MNRAVGGAFREPEPRVTALSVQQPCSLLSLPSPMLPGRRSGQTVLSQMEKPRVSGWSEATQHSKGLHGDRPAPGLSRLERAPPGSWQRKRPRKGT